MHRLILAAAIVTVSGCASAQGHASLESQAHTSAAERRAAIQRAQVWTKTDVASMDIMAGPVGAGSFAPDATVTCDYVDKPTTGRSPKFVCLIRPDDEVKVKFGSGNGEVFAEVAATRLLWALGFGADRVYPVQVVCHGCPDNIPATSLATIQRKMPGKDIETKKEVGWTWPELELIAPDAAPEQRAERDALKLLAAFLQHTDSKSEQQRLLCISGKDDKATGAGCTQTFMMVHDLGLTFGAANRFNRASVGSTNLEQWSREPVWTDGTRCVANLSKSLRGTLDNPVISESGRALLAGLLMQLTDTQIRNLFIVARFTRRADANDGPAIATTVDGWVAMFQQKRTEIVNRSCAAPR